MTFFSINVSSSRQLLRSYSLFKLVLIKTLLRIFKPVLGVINPCHDLIHVDNHKLHQHAAGMFL